MQAGGDQASLYVGPVQEIWCLQGYSLYDAIISLRATARDEHRFLLTLVNKAQTLLIRLDATVKERFLMCETTSLSPDDGEPLLLCAIQDWIAISCPSAPDWELDTLNVSSENYYATTNGEVLSRQLKTSPAPATQHRLATTTEPRFSAISLRDNSGNSAKRCSHTCCSGWMWMTRLRSRVGRRRVTPCYRSTFPSAPLRTGRAAFTASGSPVSVWVVSVKASTTLGAWCVGRYWRRRTARLGGLFVFGPCAARVVNAVSLGST